jgi:hypothetical protein
MKTIMGYEAPLVPPPQDYKGEFFKGLSQSIGCHITSVIRTKTLESLEHSPTPLYKILLMLNGQLVITAQHILRM